MNGFIDPVRGEMAAVDCAPCSGCAYEHDKAGCRAPKLVRLTDGQIAEMAAQVWGRASIAPQSVMGFARIVEAAVLRANNLETPNEPDHQL